MDRRYVALDGWRGICACAVVLFHAEAYSHLYGYLHNFYLCVDFFFVLSGFVITQSYRRKLLAGLSTRKFLALRLGRIYPLHIVMLGGFLAFYALKSRLLGGYTAETYSFETFIGNLFLFQSLGLFDSLSWNAPSWSISVEFYTCAIFAGGILVLRRHVWIAQLAIVLLAPIIFLSTGEKMNATYHLGLLRCVYGFSLGCLCHTLHERIKDVPVLNRSLVMSVAEILVLALALAFLRQAGPTPFSAFAPFVFAPVLLAFAQDQGAISRLLGVGPFTFLGRISYSIYMTHFLVIELLFNAGGMLSRQLGVSLHTTLIEDGRSVELLGTRMWHGDVVLFVVLTATIILSSLTYRFVEQPAYAWSRRVAGGLRDRAVPPGHAPSEQPTASRRAKRPAHSPSQLSAPGHDVLTAHRQRQGPGERRLPIGHAFLRVQPVKGSAPEGGGQEPRRGAVSR